MKLLLIFKSAYNYNAPLHYLGLFNTRIASLSLLISGYITERFIYPRNKNKYMNPRLKVGKRLLIKGISAICTIVALDSPYTYINQKNAEPKTVEQTIKNLKASIENKEHFTLEINKNYFKIETNEDYFIEENKEQKSNKNILERLSNEDQKIFSYLKDSMTLEDYDVYDQDGKKIEARELLSRSIGGEAARNYAKNLAEAARMKSKGRYKTLESKINLAKEVVDSARKQIQRADRGGKGYYSHGYEYSKERDNLLEQLIASKMVDDEKNMLLNIIRDSEFFGADSTQTFDEFYKEKDGRTFAGDCDDFSMALTTVYNGLKEYAESNKDKDNFYQALSEGLTNYRIVSIGIIGHALNMSITLRDKPYFQIIEPQGIESKMDLEITKNGAYVKELNSDKTWTINKIMYLFNKDLSAKAKKEKITLHGP